MYSSKQPPACVDRVWTKSSYSGTGDDCVETTPLAEGVGVRDSKNPGGGYLTFSRSEWAAFLGGIKAGEL